MYMGAYLGVGTCTGHYGTCNKTEVHDVYIKEAALGCYFFLLQLAYLQYIDEMKGLLML